jgi:NAD(P)-dependent dehydrogenase (short-subunit alcohol dehydrogenase family)
VAVVKQVCLLTGASGTLGTAFIERHATAYDIIGVHNSRPILWPTSDGQCFIDPLDPSATVAANEHAVHAIPADLSDLAGVRAVVDEVAAHVDRVDVLINCIGGGTWTHLLSPVALECAADVFQINALAPLQLTIAVAQRFWRSDVSSNLENNRNVVNISSTAGLVVYPDLGQGLYAGAKAALNYLTYHMASDFWDYGIRVNAVAPNSFPRRVSVNEVLDTVQDLVCSQRTGEVVPLFGKQ